MRRLAEAARVRSEAERGSWERGLLESLWGFNYQASLRASLQQKGLGFRIDVGKPAVKV